MEDVTLMFGWLGFFAAAFFAWFYYLQARTKERTLLIEKGADASNFYARKPERCGFRFKFPWLKLGLLLVGISLGLTIGLIVLPMLNLSIRLQPAIFGVTLLFAGLSMIVAHLTDKKERAIVEDIYIKKAIEGDEEGYRYFIRRYQDMAFSIAISVVKNEFLAEEVVQEAFMKAFEKMTYFKGHSKFSTWFYRIIVNIAFRKLEKEKRWKNEPLVIVDDVFDTQELDVLEQDERKYFINEALKMMTANESLALRLFYLEELSLSELKDITGWSSSKVKVVLHRARKSFYSCLNNLLKHETKLII